MGNYNNNPHDNLGIILANWDGKSRLELVNDLAKWNRLENLMDRLNEYSIPYSENRIQWLQQEISKEQKN